MKKNQPRRTRVPKRGPGVAELEKILKEQTDQDSAMNEPDELSSSPSFGLSHPSSSFFHNLHHSQSFNSPPPPPPLPPFPPPFVRNDGDGGESRAHLSEKNLFPTGESDTAVTFPLLYPLAPRENNLQYNTSMKTYVPGSGASSSSYPPACSSAGRQFHQIEHPSSQRSTSFNYKPLFPEEEKMIRAKRPRPYSVESLIDPNLHSKAPISQNMGTAVREPPSSSSSSLERNQFYVLSWDIFRGPKRDVLSELLNSTKSISNYQTGDINFISSGNAAVRFPPPSSQSFQHEIATFDFLPSQETLEESQRRAGASGTDDNRTLSLQLESRENPTNTGTSKEKAEAEGDDIDLNLKL